jgi:hypothetical protein
MRTPPNRASPPTSPHPGGPHPPGALAIQLLLQAIIARAATFPAEDGELNMFTHVTAEGAYNLDPISVRRVARSTRQLSVLVGAALFSSRRLWRATRRALAWNAKAQGLAADSPAAARAAAEEAAAREGVVYHTRALSGGDTSAAAVGAVLRGWGPAEASEFLDLPHGPPVDAAWADCVLARDRWPLPIAHGEGLTAWLGRRC